VRRRLILEEESTYDLCRKHTGGVSKTKEGRKGKRIKKRGGLGAGERERSAKPVAAPYRSKGPGEGDQKTAGGSKEEEGEG